MLNINNVEYAWADMHVMFAGRPFQGIRGLEYKVTTDKETIYGAGNKPHSIQHGNKTYEGTLTLLQSEFEALEDAAVRGGYEDITDITTDIIVTYIPRELGRTTTEVLKNCSFKEYQKGMKVGDKMMEISLPFTFMNKERKAF